VSYSIAVGYVLFTVLVGAGVHVHDFISAFVM